MELRRQLLSLLLPGKRVVRPMESYDILVEEVAEALYREELLRGAWAADIGIWGPFICRKEAARIIARRCKLKVG